MFTLSLGALALCSLVIIVAFYSEDKGKRDATETIKRIENNQLLWNEINTCLRTTLSQRSLYTLHYSGFTYRDLVGPNRYYNFPCIYICILNRYQYTDETDILSRKVAATIKKYLQIYGRQPLLTSFITDVNGYDYLVFVYPETDQERIAFCDIMRPAGIRKPKRRQNS